MIGGGWGRQSDAGTSEFGIVDDSTLNSDISKYLRGSLVGYFGTEIGGSRWVTKTIG